LQLLLAFGLGALLLGACCPPNCPPSPLILPQTWNEMFEAGNCKDLLPETTAVIRSGPQAEYYAEALLYRGLANQCVGNLEAAIEDLSAAERLSDQLVSVDERLEMRLLLRGQMTARARLGVMQGDPGLIEEAEKYRDGAVEMFPEARESIEREFQDALRLEQ
jgi:tetratricopeptide (TPR) repeat protein